MRMSDELKGADFGDVRLTKRLLKGAFGIDTKEIAETLHQERREKKTKTRPKRPAAQAGESTETSADH